MLKTVFCDFYGTVVLKNGAFAYKAAYEIVKHGADATADEVLIYWRQKLKNLMRESDMGHFRKERELIRLSFEKTLRHFGADCDVGMLCTFMEQNFIAPQVFEDAAEFLRDNRMSVCFIADSDNAYIEEAVKNCGFAPAGVVTSEQAGCYKTGKGIFTYALQKFGLAADEVIHIGDSLPGDVACAGMAGISAVWLNRSGNPVPDGVVSAASFAEVSDYLEHAVGRTGLDV